MKARRLIVLAAFAWSLAQGQPVVNFNNIVSGVFRASVLGVDPLFPLTQFRGDSGPYGGPLLAGSGYTAELWGGTLGSTEDSLAPLGATTFRSNTWAGFVVARQVPVPAVPIGTRATFQVRAWDNLGGTVTNWIQAQSGDFGAYGSSALFSPPDTLGTNPLNLVGLTSFNLVAPKSLTNVVPDCVPVSRSTIAWCAGPASRFPLDLDRDGTPDFTFWAGQGQCTADVPISACSTPFYVAPLGANELLLHASEIWIRPAGVSIGGVTATNTLWITAGQRLTYLWSSPRLGFAGWTTPLGKWGAGYLGARFRASDGWHYGWIHVQLDGGPVITDWAYETRPEVAICSGARPVIVQLAAPQVIRPGQLRLRWLSEVGKAYQVQSKDRIDAPRWTNLDFTVIATSTNSVVDMPIVGTTRFFRVVEAE